MEAVNSGSSTLTAEPVSLPLLDRQVEQFRTKLLAEAGLNVGRPSHFKRPVERHFTKSERDRVTILFGGLSLRHEQLILAGLRGLGYNVALVPTPCKNDFQAGKEFGNNGQCNPTYFTVGALVNYLKRLRDEEGMPTQKVLDDYLFITAGACGPCRFGMYEAEYRLALRNSGFDGFRVMLFQQEGGLDQADLEAGLEFNVDFFLTILNSIFMGDLLNEVAYQTRPYETVAGRSNDVFGRCVELCQKRLGSKSYGAMPEGRLARLLAKVVPVKGPSEMETLLDQFRGTYYTDAFAESSRLIDDEIEVDYTRPKPIVKITGEFWAQTTEGDGNFNMFRFLEGEGAEVLVEPVGTWIAYLLNQARNQQKDQHGLSEGDAPPGRWAFGQRLRLERQHRASLAKLWLANKLVLREYERLRKALGNTAHELVNQQELVRLGHPYYNSRSGGGEGHLEVAKNIYYCNKDLAHMVLALKPFGCMPSAQSDGAQSAVMANFPEMIFLPIETSGEGDVNAHSRVQMALGEAKVKCKEEFARAVAQAGHSLEEIRSYVRDHRELRRPLQRIPHAKGFIGRAANFVIHVGGLMDRDASARTSTGQSARAIHSRRNKVRRTSATLA